MKIDCISDLHGEKPALPGGDMLILAGDYTARHTTAEFKLFFDWLIEQDYKYKIMVGGNHDDYLQKNVMYGDMSMNLGKREDGGYQFYYLCETSVTIEGLKIYGTPWTKTFPGIAKNCMAFTVESDEKLSEKWEMIPEDVDILVTHSPPIYIGDEVNRGPYKENVGSKTLGTRIQKTNLKLHVYGHVHNGYGKQVLNRISDDHAYTFINASHMDEDYEPVNPPIRFEL